MKTLVSLFAALTYLAAATGCLLLSWAAERVTAGRSSGWRVCPDKWLEFFGL